MGAMGMESIGSVHGIYLIQSIEVLYCIGIISGIKAMELMG